MNQNVFEMLQWEKMELRRRAKKKEYRLKCEREKRKRYSETVKHKRNEEK